MKDGESHGTRQRHGLELRLHDRSQGTLGADEELGEIDLVGMKELVEVVAGPKTASLPSARMALTSMTLSTVFP
jgi:hypothetical protein